MTFQTEKERPTPNALWPDRRGWLALRKSENSIKTAPHGEAKQNGRWPANNILSLDVRNNTYCTTICIAIVFSILPRVWLLADNVNTLQLLVQPSKSASPSRINAYG